MVQHWLTPDSSFKTCPIVRFIGLALVSSLMEHRAPLNAHKMEKMAKNGDIYN